MIINAIARSVRNSNWSTDGEERRENPGGLLGWLAVAGLVGLGGYAVYELMREDKSIKGGGGGQPCEVTFTEEQVLSDESQQIFMLWAGQWYGQAGQSGKPAKDAAIDLMKRFAPACTWNENTNATIHRVDGTSISWSSVMSMLGNQTIAQSGNQVGELILGTPMIE